MSGSVVTASTVPCFYTMPETVAEKMDQQMNDKWILREQKEGRAEFKSMMDDGYSVTEILNLPSPKEILSGKMTLPAYILFGREEITYTKEEMILHLKSVIGHLRNHKNYHVILASDRPPNELVYLKEDVCAALMKNDFPGNAFIINEPRMVASFWEYLDELQENRKGKAKTIERLRAYIKTLSADD